VQTCAPRRQAKNALHYQSAALFDWVGRVPAHFLANNFGLPPAGLPTFKAADQLLLPA
jgi:hypothetical protein